MELPLKRPSIFLFLVSGFWLIRVVGGVTSAAV